MPGRGCTEPGAGQPRRRPGINGREQQLPCCRACNQRQRCGRAGRRRCIRSRGRCTEPCAGRRLVDACTEPSAGRSHRAQRRARAKSPLLRRLASQAAQVSAIAGADQLGARMHSSAPAATWRARVVELGWNEASEGDAVTQQRCHRAHPPMGAGVQTLDRNAEARTRRCPAQILVEGRGSSRGRLLLGVAFCRELLRARLRVRAKPRGRESGVKLRQTLGARWLRRRALAANLERSGPCGMARGAESPGARRASPTYACALAPSTHHPAPSSQHPHPAPRSQHPAPSTQHPTPSTPSTQHTAPSTQHPATSTQHPAPSTQYPTPITQHPAPFDTDGTFIRAGSKAKVRRSGARRAQ
jgi:hypothetical protein